MCGPGGAVSARPHAVLLAVDDVEGVAFEVLDVLEDEGAKVVEVEDVGEGEEEVACFTSSKPWRRPRLSFFETPAMLKGSA